MERAERGLDCLPYLVRGQLAVAFVGLTFPVVIGMGIKASRLEEIL